MAHTRTSTTTRATHEGAADGFKVGGGLLGALHALVVNGLQLLFANRPNFPACGASAPTGCQWGRNDEGVSGRRLPRQGDTPDKRTAHTHTHTQTSERWRIPNTAPADTAKSTALGRAQIPPSAAHGAASEQGKHPREGTKPTAGRRAAPVARPRSSTQRGVRARVAEAQPGPPDAGGRCLGPESPRPHPDRPETAAKTTIAFDGRRNQQVREHMAAAGQVPWRPIKM